MSGKFVVDKTCSLLSVLGRNMLLQSKINRKDII